MYFSNVLNPELAHFHQTVGVDFTMPLSEIIHKTNGAFDNKLFKIEEIITDNLYRIYPLFYCKEVISSNNEDKVDNTRCLIVLKQSGHETYFSFLTDETRSNVIIDETYLSIKDLGDTLTTDEFNAFVYRLRKHSSLTGTINYENTNEIVGVYGTYQFGNLTNQLRNNEGLIVNQKLKDNQLTVKLVNPFFVNARYVLTFTVRSITGANVCEDSTNRVTETTFDVELVKDTPVGVDLSDYVNDSILDFDVAISVSFDVPEIVKSDFTLTLSASEDDILISETVDLTATLTGTVVANYNIEFYEDNVLIDTIQTDNTGKAVVTREPLTAGNHVYTCRFIGMTASTNVTVSKKPTSLTAVQNHDSLYYGDEYVLTGTLLVNNEAVSGLNVKVYQDNVLIDTLLTDNQGKVEYSSSNLDGGTYNFKLIYEGSAEHESANSNIISTTIHHITISISSDTYNPQPNSTFNISGVLKDNGNILTNKTIHIYRDSTLWASTTRNPYSFPFSSGSQGSTIYNLRAVYVEGGRTFQSEIISVLVGSKISTTIETVPPADTTNFRKGDTVTVSVKDSSNNVIPLSAGSVVLSDGLTEYPLNLLDSTHMTYTFDSDWPYEYSLIFKETSNYYSSTCQIYYDGA